MECSGRLVRYNCRPDGELDAEACLGASAGEASRGPPQGAVATARTRMAATSIQHAGHGKNHGKNHGQNNPTWLAMGVIVTRWLPVFRARTTAGVEWRFVTTDTKHSSDPRFVVVDCPDVFYSNATSFGAGGRPKIAMGFQFSCFCKTVSWFRQALTVVPSARFVGKMEDDSVLHDARVVAELAFAHRLARREASSSSSSLPLLWYGHFAWAAFLSPTGTGHAKFCGDGDDLLLRSETRSLCGKSSLSGTVAPFASGGLDIRSRSLVEALSECAELWEFVKGFNPTNQSYGASCDGQQGYFVARCLQLPAASAVNGAASASAADSDGSGGGAAAGGRGNTRVATALHLPWPKFHPPSRRHGARLHSSLLHPHRPCSKRKAGLHDRSADGHHDMATTYSCGPLAELPSTWRWNVGHGLLPFRFKLHGERKSSDSPASHMWWEAYNKSELKLYNRLHVHREDDKYCDVLPCGVAAAPTGSTGLLRRKRDGTLGLWNASVCGGMVECWEGDGGRYYYQGPQTGLYVRT